MPVNADNVNFKLVAPNFQLLSVDGKNYNLDDLKGPKGTVIAFICNHCPYVIQLIERFVYDAKELSNIGVSTITIMSNDVDKYPEDSFDNMIKFSNKYNFRFKYLYDSSQYVAKKFDAVCTPDFFGFNNELKLEYRGRLDSKTMANSNKYIKRDLFHAMEVISNTGKGPKKQNYSFGCSIKWRINE